MKRLILVAGLTAAIAVPAFAQGNKPPAMRTTSKAPSTQTFVKKAAITNMFEIKSGQIADKKSNNPQVQQFARMIINDHQQMQNKLEAAAKNMQGVKVPTKLDSKHQKMIKQLQSASGAKFLRTFKNQEVAGHKQAIQMFQSYAQDGQNSALQQLAKSGVPELQEHLRTAQSLPTSASAPTVGAGSSSNSTGSSMNRNGSPRR
jgi:putative membrane protein